MSTIDTAKRMAKALRASLATRDQNLPHSAALEIVAQQLGYKDWNTASAMLPPAPDPSAIRFETAIPILRMFDEAKAREFYLEFLVFTAEFGHCCEAVLLSVMGLQPDGQQGHPSERP